MPSIYVQALQFKQALIQREAQAARQMVAAYEAIIERLERDQKRLWLQLQGQEISEWQLRRDARFKALIAQAERELAMYARFTKDLTENRQYNELYTGADDAAALVDTATVGASFNRLPVGAIENLVGVLRDESPLASVLKEFAGTNAGRIKDVLLQGVAAGWNPRKIAAEFRRGLELPRARALMIARTESLRAYRLATQETYKANSDIIRKWQWVASKSRRTCLNCLSRDGSLWELEKPLPAHPSCRCVAIPVLTKTPPPRETGAQWFERQSATVKQELMGIRAFELYERGEISLKDFEGRKEDARWGVTTYQRSLREIQKRQARRASA